MNKTQYLLQKLAEEVFELIEVCSLIQHFGPADHFQNFIKEYNDILGVAYLFKANGIQLFDYNLKTKSVMFQSLQHAARPSDVLPAVMRDLSRLGRIISKCLIFDLEDHAPDKAGSPTNRQDLEFQMKQFLHAVEFYRYEMKGIPDQSHKSFYNPRLIEEKMAKVVHWSERSRAFGTLTESIGTYHPSLAEWHKDAA